MASMVWTETFLFSCALGDGQTFLMACSLAQYTFCFSLIYMQQSAQKRFAF